MLKCSRHRIKLTAGKRYAASRSCASALLQPGHERATIINVVSVSLWTTESYPQIFRAADDVLI